MCGPHCRTKPTLTSPEYGSDALEVGDQSVNRKLATHIGPQVYTTQCHKQTSRVSRTPVHLHTLLITGKAGVWPTLAMTLKYHAQRAHTPRQTVKSLATRLNVTLHSPLLLGPFHQRDRSCARDRKGQDPFNPSALRRSRPHGDTFRTSLEPFRSPRGGGRVRTQQRWTARAALQPWRSPR